MDTFNAAIDFVLGLIFRTFSWFPVLGLAVISALAGVGMLWIFQKTSDQAKIRAVKRRVQAHLMELRIYPDEPAGMWQGPKAVFNFNPPCFGLNVRPAPLIAPPLAL